MAFIKVGNRVLKFGGMVITNDPNPLHLPPFTIRCKFKSGYTPEMGTSQTLVDASENVWDIGFDSASSLFYSNTNIIEVIGANTSALTDMSFMFNGCTSLTSVPVFDTSSVTNMLYMFNGCTSLTTVLLFDTSSVTNMNCTFYGCTSLTTVPRFDTSSVTNMKEMFRGCTSLTSVPLFDTSSVTDMTSMFNGCTAVTGGALALYRQASTQTALSPQSTHRYAFKNCGSNTTIGAAELAQIPSSWK